MKERLTEILNFYQISSAQFAETIGVQRSSISHILSGRNMPSYDFLMKILDKFDKISAEWLLRGQGDMLKHELLEKQNNASNTNYSEAELTFEDNTKLPFKPRINKEIKPTNFVDSTSKSYNKGHDKSEVVTNVNKVVKVIFVYSDNTFEIFNQK